MKQKKPPSCRYTFKPQITLETSAWLCETNTKDHKILEEGMNKKSSIVLAVFLFLFCRAAEAASCYDKASKLANLQYQILQKLSPGAWASYGTIQLVYLGQRLSPKTGKRLHVIEVSGRAKGQIWYKLQSQTFIYEGKKLCSQIPNPIEVYIKMGNGYFFFTKAMVEIFLKGTAWGSLLKNGLLPSLPNCHDLPFLRQTLQTLPNGKRVKAFLIRSVKYGGEAICCLDVPFGLIKAVSLKDKKEVHLKKYGWKGGKETISQRDLKGATSITFSLNKKTKD